MRKSIFFALVLAVAASASDSRGIPARPSRAAYPITCFTERVAVGAALLRPDQVRALFGPDVETKYLVVEVGVYPKLGTIDIRHGDFALRLVGPQKLTKPAAPAEVSTSARVRALPEAGTGKPLGGYLFFSLPDPPVSTHYELDYTGYGEWMTLPLTRKK